MDDQDKTKKQLLADLAALRQRVGVLEQTEKSLRESEGRYHTLVEAVPQLMGWADANRETVEWNRRWYEYTGQTPAEARGFGWLKAVHPDDVARVRQRISETRATGGPYEAEYRVRRASDGAYRWHLARSMPMKDKDGRVTGWFGGATDIDDQKRAGAALRESEERFRKVFEEGPIGVLLVGTDGRIQHANRRFCEMLGYSESEIIAVGLPGLSHPDDWERDYPFISRLWHGEISSYQVQKRYLRKDGQVVWAQLTVSLMHDEAGRPINTIGMIEDITERKQAEEKLKNSERTLRTLMDASPESILLLDPEGTILFANATMARRYGTTADKVVGRTAKDLLPAEVAANRTRRFQGVVRTGKAVRFEDERFDRFIENAMHPILNEQGKVAALAVLGIDRTERKWAEQALQQAHDELERRVEERTAELTKANEELTLFRKFAEASGQGFGMGDLEARIAYVNPALCRMFGEDKPEDIIGKSFIDYYPEEWRQRRKEEMIPALDGAGHWTGEQAVLSRQGQLIPTLHDVFFLRDEKGNPICRCVVVTDITERKRAEEALRQSRDEIQAIYDSMVDGLLIGDCVTGRLLRTNPAICRMLGYSEDELLSLSVKEIHPAEVALAVLQEFGTQQEWQRPIAQNRPMLRKDGTVFYTDISNVRISYQGRSCMIGIFRDVTERKQAQEALQREQRTLRHLLQSSDHERQLIAYEIHDGLAQYLAGAIMQFDVYTHLKEKRPRDAAKAYDAGVTMLRQGHFEARRLISGLRPPILDEEGIVAAIAHLVGEEQRKKVPKIEYLSMVEFERLTPILENAVYRIAQEALTNACRHSQSKKVRVELVQQGDQFRIEVQDRGVGFTPENVAEGQFGLAGIRERARLLGGKATIDSTVGKGTRIVVELPIVLRRDDDEAE